MVRYELRITGDVQGVGFRYRAHHAANLLRLTGWVKNEWDGSVLMEVQGEDASIDEMFHMISKGTYISIDGIERKILPVDEDERGFHVRG